MLWKQIETNITAKNKKKAELIDKKEKLTTKKDHYKAMLPQLEGVISALNVSATNLANAASGLRGLISGGGTTIITCINTVNSRSSTASGAAESLTEIKSQTNSSITLFEGEIKKMKEDIDKIEKEIKELNLKIQGLNTEIDTLYKQNEYLETQLYFS